MPNSARKEKVFFDQLIIFLERFDDMSGQLFEVSIRAILGSKVCGVLCTFMLNSKRSCVTKKRSTKNW